MTTTYSKTSTRDPPPGDCPHCGHPLRASAAVEHVNCWRNQRTRTTTDHASKEITQ
jgi:hypothetical protein